MAAKSWESLHLLLIPVSLSTGWERSAEERGFVCVGCFFPVQKKESAMIPRAPPEIDVLEDALRRTLMTCMPYCLTIWLKFACVKWFYFLHCVRVCPVKSKNIALITVKYCVFMHQWSTAEMKKAISKIFEEIAVNLELFHTYFLWLW